MDSSDSETDDAVLEILLADEQDSKEILRTAKLRGKFSLEQQTDAWCIENCR